MGRHIDAAAFVARVSQSPGFWTFDYQLKYLTLTIDTREGAYFSLKDRDGNLIEPERVYAAIDRWREFLTRNGARIDDMKREAK